MRRREFIALLGGAVAWPLAARAQERKKIPRIGVLAAGIPSTYTFRFDAFRQGLRELGYVESQNIVLEYRYADGKYERLPALAAELVNRNVDLIVAVSAPETAAAKRVTSIPIVFLQHGDPIQTGDVLSVANPGGNITGIASMGPDLAPKRLQLLKEAFSHIARVAVLWNATNPAKVIDWREVQAVAPAVGVTVLSHEVRRPEDFATVFAAMTTQRPDALLILSDPLTLNSRTSIVAFAASARLPAIYGVREFAEAGGLMVYAPKLADMYGRAASYVHRILNGAKPADLPIEQPTKFELVINLRVAKALGLDIPLALLARADEVIE